MTVRASSQRYETKVVTILFLAWGTVFLDPMTGELIGATLMPSIGAALADRYGPAMMDQP
jgi:hypothetical protein